MDPFAGKNRDPQSLHKYLYAHCNPINGIDPSGKFWGGFAITVFIIVIVAVITTLLIRSCSEEEVVSPIQPILQVPSDLPPGAAYCIFDLSESTLTCIFVGTVVTVEAFSGGGINHDHRQNNPDYELENDGGGPLPRGRWWIGQYGGVPRHPTWYRLYSRFETLRTDIYLHEGTYSVGCLTVPQVTGDWQRLRNVLERGRFENPDRANDYYTAILDVQD